MLLLLEPLGMIVLDCIELLCLLHHKLLSLLRNCRGWFMQIVFCIDDFGLNFPWKLNLLMLILMSLLDFHHSLHMERQDNIFHYVLLVEMLYLLIKHSFFLQNYIDCNRLRLFLLLIKPDFLMGLKLKILLPKPLHLAELEPIKVSSDRFGSKLEYLVVLFDMISCFYIQTIILLIKLVLLYSFCLLESPFRVNRIMSHHNNQKNKKLMGKMLIKLNINSILLMVLFWIDFMELVFQIDLMELRILFKHTIVVVFVKEIGHWRNWQRAPY